jgi:hypothetical protein
MHLDSGCCVWIWKETMDGLNKTHSGSPWERDVDGLDC